MVLILERVIPVTCNQEIVIIPSVIEGDPGLSTFRWEQLTGTPVEEYLTPLTELELSFVQTQERDDKLFQLIVDEGTDFVQVLLVLVTAIPTDYLTPEFRAVLPSLGDELVPDGGATYSHLAPELVGFNNQVLNPPLRSVGFQTPAVVDLYNNPSRVDLVEEVSEGVFSAPVQTVFDLRGKFHGFDNLQPNLTYRLITRVQQFRLDEIVDISPPFSAVSPRHPANPELAIDDEVAQVSQQFGHSAGSVLEVITRSVEVYQGGEDTSFTEWNAIHDTYGSVLEVINRELWQLDEPEDLAWSGQNARHLSAASILEVMQLDYSSLG